MKDAAMEFLERLQVGEARTCRKLRLFPLTGETPWPGRYLLLDEPHESGLAETREGSDSEVLVVNNSAGLGFFFGRAGKYLGDTS